MYGIQEVDRSIPLASTIYSQLPDCTLFVQWQERRGDNTLKHGRNYLAVWGNSLSSTNTTMPASKPATLPNCHLVKPLTGLGAFTGSVGLGYLQCENNDHISIT